MGRFDRVTMGSVVAWLKASRLPSQSYIALPLLFGQAYFFYQGGELSWPILILVQLFGLFDQLFIVYANDYADRETDRLNQTATTFSGGSRVLVDGDLRPGQLRHAAVLMAGLCLLVALGLGLGYGRWWTLLLASVGLLLLWAYSFAPILLSYRGGGELLQMVGVGLVLPVFGYYAQAGTLAGFPWPMLLVLLPTHLACAIATALPDEPSDRLSSKRTAVILLGPLRARLVIFGLDLASLFAFTQVSWMAPEVVALASFLFVPALASLGQPLFFASRPGSRGIRAHVFLAVLVTLSLMATMCVALLLA